MEMIEIIFEISGAVFVDDETLDDYKVKDEVFDLKDLVLDNVSLGECGELTVTDAYFG